MTIWLVDYTSMEGNGGEGGGGERLSSAPNTPPAEWSTPTNKSRPLTELKDVYHDLDHYRRTRKRSIHGDRFELVLAASIMFAAVTIGLYCWNENRQRQSLTNNTYRR